MILEPDTSWSLLFDEFWSEFSGQLISAHISVHPNTYVGAFIYDVRFLGR
jgi:hypothetical protein